MKQELGSAISNTVLEPVQHVDPDILINKKLQCKFNVGKDNRAKKVRVLG